MTYDTSIHVPDPEPSRCPNCKRIENTKTLCRHCDYEYAEDNIPPWQIILASITVAVVFLWVILTAGSWFMDSDSTTLFQVIADQIHWLRKLRIW